MIIEALLAIVKLGLPVALLSWVILLRLYRRGQLTQDDDRKAVDARIKQLQQAEAEADSEDSSWLQARWLKFGGGFYGSAALWTFFVIEVIDAFRLVTAFPGFATLLADGWIKLLVNLLVNQVMNFVDAIVWFRFWATSDQYIAIWMLVAFGAHLLGTTLARRSTLQAGPPGQA